MSQVVEEAVMVGNGGLRLLNSFLFRWVISLLEDLVVWVHLRKKTDHPVARWQVAAQVDCQPLELLLQLLTLPVLLVLDHAADHVTHVVTRRWI